MIITGTRGDPTSPSGRIEAISAEKTGVIGKVGIDATVPFEYKWLFTRARYPQVDLSRWLSKEEIEKVRDKQSDYAQFLAGIAS